MIYGDLQFFDILIFAAIAGFIIYRLRSVLGKRTGFQKNISQAKTQETKKITLSAEDISSHKEMLKKIKNPIWNKFNY